MAVLMNTGNLEVRDLCFAYPDGTRALDSISFGIACGASIGLIGANGAGKSTLLMQLNGTLLPECGEIRVSGMPLLKKTIAAVRRAVGIVFQDPDDQLFMPTVFEDVVFGPLNAGLTTPDAERLALAALERVGASHLRNRPPYRLSAGEKRAVAIATALALEPEILIMDEPSSNLDPRGRRRLVELLKSLKQTKIIATHDLELVVEVCSEVILLDAGRLVVRGRAVELLNDEPLMLKHGLERPHILRHRHPHGFRAKDQQTEV